MKKGREMGKGREGREGGREEKKREIKWRDGREEDGGWEEREKEEGGISRCLGPSWSSFVQIHQLLLAPYKINTQPCLFTSRDRRKQLSEASSCV